MHAPADAYTDELADLEKLAAELTARDLLADIRTTPGRLPCLDVRNPRASALTERVYSQADSFWWSWAHRIAGCDQVAETASILARVLRAVGEEAPAP